MVDLDHRRTPGVHDDGDLQAHLLEQADRFEVGLAVPGDKRAWDAWLDGPGDIAIDAETRLQDVQDLQRRLELKWRDSGRPRVVLVVSASRHNRRVIREHRAALACTLPLDTREVLASLRVGEVPRANGIVFVRPASWDRSSSGD